MSYELKYQDYQSHDIYYLMLLLHLEISFFRLLLLIVNLSHFQKQRTLDGNTPKFSRNFQKGNKKENFIIGDNVLVFYHDTWKKVTIIQVYPEGMYHKEKLYHVKYDTGNEGQFFFNQMKRF